MKERMGRGLVDEEAVVGGPAQLKLTCIGGAQWCRYLAPSTTSTLLQVQHEFDGSC